jgi:hypothetical protein
VKSKLFIFAIAAALVCAWVAWFCARYFPLEPRYQGKSLSAWLDAEAYRDTTWWPGHQATEAAVRAMGTNAVPFLLRRYRRCPDAPSKFKEKVAELLWRVGLPGQALRYYDTYGSDRLGTVFGAFHALQPRAKEVLPVLIGAYNQRKGDKVAVLHALAWLGAKEALPFVIGEAGNTNAYVRATSFWVLGTFDWQRSSVIPTLVKGLRDDDPYTRDVCVQAFIRLGPQAPQAMPDLLRILEAETEAVRSPQDAYDHRSAKTHAEAALMAIRSR